MVCDSRPSREAAPARAFAGKPVRLAESAQGFRRPEPAAPGGSRSVYVAHLEAVDEQPVEAGEVVGALLEGGGMSLLEVARHRARHMHWVLQPRSWPRRLKTESGYHACATHKGLSTGCGLVIPLQASRIFVDFALSDKTNRRIEP